MKIKAIETSYKGYRFRSRLEARWAVALDKLGIKWEYEKEGYDLGDLGYYLPDFWLPDQETFVEIKPENKAKRARQIYLAGKMGAGKSNWRNDLAWLGSNSYDLDEYEMQVREIRPVSMVNGHCFCGPYRVDDMSGHGWGHIALTYDHGGHNADHAEGWSTVFNGCKRLIGHIDTMFAWIDTADCFGTLAEIGYAHALSGGR